MLLGDNELNITVKYTDQRGRQTDRLDSGINIHTERDTQKHTP